MASGYYNRPWESEIAEFVQDSYSVQHSCPKNHCSKLAKLHEFHELSHICGCFLTSAKEWSTISENAGGSLSSLKNMKEQTEQNVVN